LSGGQQRRVQFALAICGDPQLLFLDEPTTGLDLEARQMLWQAIRALVARGAAVLLTTHYLEEAEALADRVVVLNRGRVAAAGTMHEIRAHVSQRRIRCVSALDPSRIATWPHVRSARATGGAAKGSSTVEAATVEAGTVGVAMAVMPSMPSVAARNRGHGRSHMAGEFAGIEIVTDAAESVVRRLLAEDAALSDLEIQRAGLADAFIELTRNDAMPEAA
jgi:ABC-2 type transport system ATP-binding protein